MLRRRRGAEQPGPPATAVRGVRWLRRRPLRSCPGSPVSFWTVLVYLFLALLSLTAVVGGLVVVKRLEAQRRLREELARLEGGLDLVRDEDDDRAG